MPPDISILIPARNEGPRLADTIRSVSQARSTNASLEFVIADDDSTDNTEGHIRAAWDELRTEPRIDVIVSRLPVRTGVPGSRNHAASLATADIVFTTDAHVRFSEGWDELVFKHIDGDRVLAGAISESNSNFVGYGCRLVVPFMGTFWNKQRLAKPAEVQVAACSATVLPRELYERLGGYDPGMLRYGAAEPEFSVRAWLYGAEVLVIPDLVVEHRFKPLEERDAFIRSVRPDMVHNAMRFGLLYLSEYGGMQLLRYYARKFPNLFVDSLRTLEAGDVWERRRLIEEEQTRPFPWFVEHFGLRDSLGGELL